MRTPVVVIGAGHAGLTVSRELAERSVDHVVLERGAVANSWRNERWDSFRLLTPNWQTRLPGLAYDGDDPDGFMTTNEVVEFVERYARSIDAPITTNTQVDSVRGNGNGYRVTANGRTWDCKAVVLATGAFNRPALPKVAGDLPAGVASVTPDRYRRPRELDEGPVLVVGASATGIQLADEIHSSGRPVTLSVGEHVRMPRLYRDRDIFWWMDRIGRLDERYDQVDDIVRARNVASPQLVGTPERKTLDLNALSAAGVRLAGRVEAIVESKVVFSGALPNVCKLADLKLGRLLDTIDEWVRDHGLDSEVGPRERPQPTAVDQSPLLSLDLGGEGFKTVVWATGYRTDYSWLDVPVLDRKGEIRHDGGIVTDSPGLYRIGLNFLRRRKSSFIHGAEDDARDLTDHLSAHLKGQDPGGRSRSNSVTRSLVGGTGWRW